MNGCATGRFVYWRRRQLHGHVNRGATFVALTRAEALSEPRIVQHAELSMAYSFPPKGDGYREIWGGCD